MKIAKRLRLSWQLAITVLLAVAMVSTPFLGTATAQAASNAQAGTAIHYSDKQVLADGGINYTFNINGVSNILHEPPDGFTPATATDAQLAEYGFPARPTDTATLATWTAKWSHFKYQRSSSDPVLTIMSGKVSPGVAASPQVTTHPSSSPVWSGYADYDVNVNQFQGATGEYNQPTYGSDSQQGASGFSFVGLGGWLNNASLMVGSAMVSGPTYYAWYQYTNSSGNYTIIRYSGAVNPGDDIELQTYWQPSSNYPAGFSYFDFNTMTNFYITAQLTSAYYDGETAEYMDGRPVIATPHNEGTTPLDDYGSNNWQNCGYWITAGSGNATPFTNYNYLIFTMQDQKSGDILSQPSNPNGASFTDTFAKGS